MNGYTEAQNQRMMNMHASKDGLRVSGAMAVPQDLSAEPSALATQVGGDHYKTMAIQPAEYCHLNGIGKLEGDVIAYVSRWRKKNGIEDLKKARHTIDLIIEIEERNKP